MECEEPEDVGNNSRKADRRDYSNYRMVKRNKPKLPRSSSHVYVHNKTSIQRQMDKCLQILRSGQETIIIHGLGSAISTAINLAFNLHEELGIKRDIEANTSTVDIIHDFIPLSDDLEPFSTSKSCSAIHIRISHNFTS